MQAASLDVWSELSTLSLPLFNVPMRPVPGRSSCPPANRWSECSWRSNVIFGFRVWFFFIFSFVCQHSCVLFVFFMSILYKVLFLLNFSQVLYDWLLCFSVHVPVHSIYQLLTCTFYYYNT